MLSMWMWLCVSCSCQVTVATLHLTAMPACLQIRHPYSAMPGLHEHVQGGGSGPEDGCCPSCCTSSRCYGLSQHDRAGKSRHACSCGGIGAVCMRCGWRVASCLTSDRAAHICGLRPQAHIEELLVDTYAHAVHSWHRTSLSCMCSSSASYTFVCLFI